MQTFVTFVAKNPKKMLKIKITENSEVILIIQGN